MHELASNCQENSLSYGLLLMASHLGRMLSVLA